MGDKYLFNCLKGIPCLTVLLWQYVYNLMINGVGVHNNKYLLQFVELSEKNEKGNNILDIQSFMLYKLNIRSVTHTTLHSTLTDQNTHICL